MRKVILDVDTGSDDAIAIMLAYLSKKLDIIGITVTWGNNPVDKCVDATLQVLELMNADIPVYRGCAGPILRLLDQQRAEANKGNAISFVNQEGETISLHPEVLPCPKATGKPQEKHACTYLIETLMNSDEKITIIPVGPATNIGMAFALEPRIKDHIEEVVFMGGAVGMGNVSPTAEANFWHDPEAVKIILKSGVKCRIVGLNATHSAPISMEMADELLALNTPFGKLAHDLIKIRAQVSSHLGWSDGSYEIIHDALAVAGVIDETVFTDIRKENVDIICTVEKEGTLVLDTETDSSNSPIEIAYKADGEKYFQMLKEAFK